MSPIQGGNAGSGDALTTNPLSQFAATTSAQLKGVISDENAPDGASSKLIMALGSLSVASGKTLTASKTLTLDGTDGTTMTFPSTSATVARTDAANTFTGVQTMTSPAITTPTGIVKGDVGLGNVDNTSDASKNSATVTLTNKTMTAPTYSAGTSSASTWPKFTSGTVLATPEAGAIEYDGAGFYATNNTTQGREAWVTVAQYYMTGDGSASGTATITDMFAANSSFSTVTNGIYEIAYDVFFLKTTAGTMVFTVTNTQTYTNLVGFYQLSNASGVATAGTLPGAGLVTTTTAAAAFTATASLTAAANHYVHVRVFAECGTAGTIRLRGTPSAGTFTTLRGSSYTVRRWTGAVGTFAA